MKEMNKQLLRTYSIFVLYLPLSLSRTPLPTCVYGKGEGKRNTTTTYRGGVIVVPKVEEDVLQ